MASFNNPIPMLDKSFDLRDATDSVDRKLEVAQQAAAQLEGQMYPLVINSVTGTAYAATKFPRPNYITSGAGVTAYEALLTSAPVGAGQAALDTAGIKELLAALAAKLNSISSLT